MKSIFKALVRRTLPVRVLQSVKKIYYSHLLRSFSEKDEADFQVIKHIVNCGEYVIDIGANIGVYTKYLSELVGPLGRVYSIEPIPLTFEILSSNVKKFGLKNLELINCAISDNNGSVTMEVPLYDSGGENFMRQKLFMKKQAVL